MNPEGLFENWTNEIRVKRGPDDKRLTDTIKRIVERDLRGQVHLAGSHNKRTAIASSDLDLWIDTPQPVTLPQRRALARAIEAATGRSVRVSSHAVQVQASAGRAKVDLAFGDGHFGRRRQPDAADFRGQPARQQAARALKYWAHCKGFKWASGWALERMVVHLDPNRSRAGLPLFLRVVDWLIDSSNTSAIVGILTNHAETELRHDRLENWLLTMQNYARNLRRTYAPDTWTTAASVQAWLQ